MKRFHEFSAMLQRPADAIALVRGSDRYPDIQGRVQFYEGRDGLLIYAELSGLPRGTGLCDRPVFGFHIHGGSRCFGNETDPFADAGSHYDPHRCPHPYHAGDLPPLFGVNGKAVSAFLTDRLDLAGIAGKAVMIHGSPDDFKSQPAGNSGEKIACGIIILAEMR